MRRVEEDVFRTAKYVYQKWLAEPVVQNYFRIQAAASEAALTAGMAKLRSASLLVGVMDAAVTLGVPVAVWIGVFAAMGAPYAEARAIVQNANFQSGFSQGFVMGLLKWEWHQAVSRFGRFGPGQKNYFDESLSFISANAFNNGLHAGFIHAALLSPDAKSTMLKRIKSVAHGAGAGRWTRNDQISYVIELATAARVNGIFRAG